MSKMHRATLSLAAFVIIIITLIIQINMGSNRVSVSP